MCRYRGFPQTEEMNCTCHLVAALDSESKNPGSSRSGGARMTLPVGMAGDLWQGPPEGQMKPVSGVERVQSLGHVKLWV